MRSVNRKKDVPSSTIFIDYLRNAFTSTEIEEMKKTLSTEKLQLATKSHMPQHILGIEELFAQISIFLPPDIVMMLCQTIITRGTYDCLKALIMQVYKYIKNKPFSRIKNSEIIEGDIPNVHLIVGNNKIILPMNLEQDKFEYALDTFKDVVNSKSVETRHFSKFNEEKGCFECYEESELVLKIANESMKKQEETNETTI